MQSLQGEDRLWPLFFLDVLPSGSGFDWLALRNSDDLTLRMNTSQAYGVVDGQWALRLCSWPDLVLLQGFGGLPVGLLLRTHSVFCGGLCEEGDLTCRFKFGVGEDGIGFPVKEKGGKPRTVIGRVHRSIGMGGQSVHVSANTSHLYFPWRDWPPKAHCCTCLLAFSLFVGTRG